MRRLLALLCVGASAIAAGQPLPFLRTEPHRFISFDARANVSVDSEGVRARFWNFEGQPVDVRWGIAGQKLQLEGAERSDVDVGVYDSHARLRTFDAFSSLEGALEDGSGRVVLTRGPQGFHYALALSSPEALRTLRLLRSGVDGAELAEGALLLRVGQSVLTESAPYCYQRYASAPLTIPCRFTDLRRELDGSHTYRIEAFGADPDRPIEIDPYVDWTRYFGLEVFQARNVASHPNDRQAAYAATLRADLGDGGQAGDIAVGWLHEDGGHERLRWMLAAGKQESFDLAVDSAGNVVVVGYSQSPEYPVAGGGFDAGAWQLDGIFTALSPTGAMLSSGYIAGPGATSEEVLSAVASVGPGQFVFGGFTNAAYDVKALGAHGYNAFWDGLLVRAKVVPPFTVEWSMHVGAASNDFVTSLDADPATGTAYAAGFTKSATFEPFAGATANQRSFLLTVHADGGYDRTQPIFVGGTASDAGGQRLDSASFSTRVRRGQGNVVWLAGEADTQAPLLNVRRSDGTTTPAVGVTGLDVWVLKTVLDGGVRVPQWLDIHGGGGDELLWDLGVDLSGEPLLIGTSTSSSTLPFADFSATVGHYPNSTLRGGNFLVQLDDGRIRHAGRFGGSLSPYLRGDVDARGNVWVAFNYRASSPEHVPSTPTFSDGGSYGPAAAVFMKLEVASSGPLINIALASDGGLHPRALPLNAAFTVTERRVPLREARVWFNSLSAPGTRVRETVFPGDGGTFIGGFVQWPPDSSVPGDNWQLQVQASNGDNYLRQTNASFKLVPLPVVPDAGSDAGTVEPDAGQPDSDGGVTQTDAGEPGVSNRSPIGFGCGCNSTGGFGLLLVAASAALLRRRRA